MVLAVNSHLSKFLCSHNYYLNPWQQFQSMLQNVHKRDHHPAAPWEAIGCQHGLLLCRDTLHQQRQLSTLCRAVALMAEFLLLKLCSVDWFYDKTKGKGWGMVWIRILDGDCSQDAGSGTWSHDKGASQCIVEYGSTYWVSESERLEEVWALKAYNGKLLELREGTDLLYIFKNLFSMCPNNFECVG